MAIATGTAMLIAAATTAGTTAASTIMSSRAQTKAAGKARQTLREQATATEKRLAPWQEAGERALETLGQKVEAGPGEFEASPGYQFRKAEGEKAISRAASARGGLWSGAHTKRLIQYGQDVATDEFDRFEDRFYRSLAPLQQLAGMGQTAAAGVAGAGEQTARGVAGTYIGEGEAKAARNVTLGNLARQTGREFLTLSDLANQSKANKPDTRVLKPVGSSGNKPGWI